VAPSTVWQILKDAGISPAPRRDGPGWAGLLRSQARAMLALDFFTADLLNGTKVYVLAVIEHGTRRIRVLGATANPVQSWVVQQARNLLMDLEDAGMAQHIAAGVHLLGRDTRGGPMTFEEFAAVRLPAVLKFAAVLAGDRGLAEDMVQEVLIRANARWQVIENLPWPEAYVRKMIVNEYLAWRRRSWRLVLSARAPTSRACPHPIPPPVTPNARRCWPSWPSCPGGSARWWCCATTRAFPIRRSPTSWAARRAPSAVMLPGRWLRSGSS
jgi:hypothetical protein